MALSQGSPKATENTGIYITTHNTRKISYEVAMKVFYGWGSPQHEELL